MDERDRRYGESFAASKDAVAAALSAQKELTAAAFAASREAINKAEVTSSANDAKNNEFRGQLRDQAATFPTRVEVEGQMGALAARFEESKKDLDRYKENQAEEIRGLRESRSEGTGASARGQQDERRSNNFDRLLLTGLGIAVSILIFAANYFGRTATPPVTMPQVITVVTSTPTPTR